MTVIMSGKYPELVSAMHDRGYKVIPTKRITCFHQPEQFHADMQVLKIRDRIFTLDTCRRKPSRDYPNNVLLNCLFLGNRLYGKLSAIDETVLDYCKEQGIELVNVNQGYTRCSTLVVNDNAVITADSSIEKAMKQNGVEVLRISQGQIRLEGFDYGFIGGCSGRILDTIFFFENIKKHSDYSEINDFIINHNSKIEILCDNMPLTDIGGFVEV